MKSLILFLMNAFGNAANENGVFHVVFHSMQVRTMHALDHKNILKFFAWYDHVCCHDFSCCSAIACCSVFGYD